MIGEKLVAELMRVISGMIVERSQWEGLGEQIGRKVSGRVSQKDLWNKYCENLVEELVREGWEECVREINQRVFF